MREGEGIRSLPLFSIASIKEISHNGFFDTKSSFLTQIFADENFICVTARSAHQGPIQITERETKTKNETVNEISSYIFSFIVSDLLGKNIQKIITR